MINTRMMKRGARTCLATGIAVLVVTSCGQLGGQPEPGLWPDPHPGHESATTSDPCAGSAAPAQELFESDDSRLCERLDWTPTHVSGWVISGRTTSYSQQWTRKNAVSTSVDFTQRQVIKRTWDWRTGRGTVTGDLTEVRRQVRVGPRDGCVINETLTDVVQFVKAAETALTTIEISGDPLHFTTAPARVAGTRKSSTYDLEQHPSTTRDPAGTCEDSHRQELDEDSTVILDWGQSLGPGVVTDETDTSITVTGSRTWTVPYSPTTEQGFTVTHLVSWNLTMDKIK